VHGKVDAAVGERLVDLLGEQALAADLRQPAIRTASPVVRMVYSNTSKLRSTGQKRVGTGEAARLDQRERRAVARAQRPL
jgi:hypothetical protein